MLPELAPYSLVTIVLAAFALGVTRLNITRPVQAYYAWTIANGYLLVLCGLNLALAPPVFSFDAPMILVVHAVLKWVFAIIVTFALPSIIDSLPQER